jgi:hypothetical protein
VEEIWLVPESRNTLVTILPPESSILNSLGGGDPLWCHFMLDRFDSGVKCTHVSSRVTVQSRSVVSSNSDQFKCMADTTTPCASWSNFIQGPTRHTLSWTVSVHGYFLQHQQLYRCRMQYHAVIRLFPKISYRHRKYSRYVQLLVEYEAGSVPHTVRLTYEDIASLSVSLGMWWYSTAVH